MPFCQRLVDSLCSQKTFNHSSKHTLNARSRYVVMGCSYVRFKSHQVVQTEATDNPTEGLFSCTDLRTSAAFLQLQGLPEQQLWRRGTTCTQTPNQARERALCGMCVILFQGPTFFAVSSQAFLLLYSCQTF